MVKLCYITTVNRNPGDTFIQYGIDYLMQQVLPLYSPHYVDKHDLRSRDINWWYLQRHPKPLRKPLSWWLRATKSNQDAVLTSDILVQSGTPFIYRILPGDPILKAGGNSASTDWIKAIWSDALDSYPQEKLLLLFGIGSCQPFKSSGAEIEEDPILVAFLQRLIRRVNLTVVRDPLAEKVLKRLGLSVYLLPCPALFAADLHPLPVTKGDIVIMNYMNGGGHYEFGQGIDHEGWEKMFKSLYNQLSRQYHCVIVCHAAKEALETRRILPDSEIFFRENPIDYLRIFSIAKFGIVNRVHAAVALAGFGRPSVVIGNDTRSLMAGVIGLPTYFVNNVTEDLVLRDVQDFIVNEKAWLERLQLVKKQAYVKYVNILYCCLNDIINMASSSIEYARTDFSSNRAETAMEWDKIRPN